jgi:hypothetical protein
MINLKVLKNLLLAGALATALVGCGSSGTDATAPSSQPATLTGTAATGAAFVGAVITVIDSRGVTVGTSAPVGSDGVYSVTLSAGALAPFVVVASRTASDGNVESYVSVAESANVTRVNVTPVTHLIASRLSKSGDPLKLANELAAGNVQITAAAVSATIAEIKTILAPILAATGTTDANPLTSAFATDGTGVDRLLDSLNINIVPSSETSANIEIGIKTTGTDGTTPAIQFKSDQSLAAITTTNSITGSSVGGTTVTSANLVEAGTSVLIANLMQDITSCYALPLSTRVSGVSGTATAVVGTASAIIAPACKTIFHNGDPATYLSNGNVVQRTANNTGSFASIFRSGATGLSFNDGRFEFARANGDLVVSYRARDAQGNDSFDTFVVRKEDGKLRLIGNQYAYPGGVSAYHQLRRFPTLSQSAYDYYSSGYTLNVDNVQETVGTTTLPKFDRVVVTTPSGNTITLWPSVGSSFMAFKNGLGNVTTTNFLRLGSAYVNSATAGSPSSVETNNLIFASPQRTDDQLAAIPQQSVWTFRYFLRGNSSATADAEQTYKTRARALAINELRTKGFAVLTPTLLSEISTGANTSTGAIDLDADGTIDVSADGNLDAWTVPTGALPPTQVKAFGRYNGSVGWDDAQSVAPTARKAIVSCTKASGGDPHCSSTVSGAFAANNALNGLHLWARDTDGREYASFYAMYKLNLVAP